MMDELTNDEIKVIMQMSDEIGIPAAQISADLHYENRNDGWTPRKVNKVHRSLREKGYAEFGHLTSEDDNSLQGRGYWLSRKGWLTQTMKSS